MMNPKITAQAISKYEKGKMLPSSTVLVALGKTLNVSLDFLMSAQVEALDGVEFRKHSGVSARDRAKAEAIVIDNLERYLEIEHILDERGTADWVKNQSCDSVADEAQIDTRAYALRDAWGLGMGPISSLCELLENKGIKVVEDDFPKTINGFTCNVLRGGKPVALAIAVSNQINVERKRFTLAHELAHIIIRSTGNPSINLEAAVNRFAGAFLIPGHRLKEEIGNYSHQISYYEIIRLKRKYGVSAVAMLVRLGQVGVLPQSSIKHSFATFARSWRTSEPEPISGFEAFEKPRRFESLVVRAVGEELISPVRAAVLLNQSLDYVEQQIKGLKSS